jgi:hypothetical protein
MAMMIAEDFERAMAQLGAGRGVRNAYGGAECAASG